MSTAIWPLIFLYLGLLATGWQHLSVEEQERYGFALMVWVGGIGVQIALVIWTFLVLEQYKTVLYVETRLRPLVEPIVGTADFWLYEKKLHGRNMLSRWLELRTEFWVSMGILMAVTARLLLFRRFSVLDWFGLLANVLVLMVLSGMALRAAKIRHKWET